MSAERMTPGKNASAGRNRTLLLVALVAVLAVVAAVGTVLVSAATYSPGDRTMSPRIQVAAGSDHVDPEAGLVVRVPEGWRAESGDLVFGTTALIPESAEGGLGGLVLVGGLTPDFVAAEESDNQWAAAALISGMGEFFLPIPGEQTDHRMEEISGHVGDGWALSYRVVPEAAEGRGVPVGGLVYTAVLGEGENRIWLTYVGSPADGAMDSPSEEWADEIVERLRFAEES